MSVGSMSFGLNTQAPPDAGDLDSSSDEDGGEREGGMDRTAPTLAQTSVASCAALPVSEEQEPSRSSDGNMMIRFDGGDVLDLPSYAFDVPLRTTGVQVVDILSKLYTRFEKLEEDNPGFLPELRIGGVVLESTGRLCDLGLNLEHTHTVQVCLVEQTELQKILAVAPTEWMHLQADSEPPQSFLKGRCGESEMHQIMDTLDDAASPDSLLLTKTIDELIAIARRSKKTKDIVRHIEKYGFLRRVYHERLIRSEDLIKDCFQSFKKLMKGHVGDEEYIATCHESAFCATKAELLRCLSKQPAMHILGEKARRSLDGATGDAFGQTIKDLDGKAKELENIADNIDQQPGMGEYKIRQQFIEHGKIDQYNRMKAGIIQAAGMNEPLSNFRGMDGEPFGKDSLKNMQKAYHEWFAADDKCSKHAEQLAGMVTPKEFEKQCKELITTLEAKASVLVIHEAERIIEDRGCLLTDQQEKVLWRVQRSVYDTVLCSAEIDLLCATETMIMGANTYNCHHPQTVKTVHDEINSRYNPFVLQGRFPNGCGCEGCGTLFACESERRDNKMIETFDYTCPESQERFDAVSQLDTCEQVQEFAKQFDCWDRSFESIGEMNELKYEVLGMNIRRYMVACRKQSLILKRIY
jgi:hypothetical protein